MDTAVYIRHAQIHRRITNRFHVGKGRVARVPTFNTRKTSRCCEGACVVGGAMKELAGLASMIDRNEPFVLETFKNLTLATTRDTH